VIALVCIMSGLENMRQKSIVRDDGIGRVHLKNLREQLGGAQSDRSDRLLRECKVSNDEL
jgi:hypothetical protein